MLILISLVLCLSHKCEPGFKDFKEVEQVRRKKSAKLKRMAFLVSKGWQDEQSKLCWLTWRLSVSLV